ncbi:MAG: ZIP family metal transporter [Flavobacteriales bacterium]|nr:ZIP family metal transporter [Flavobacteriales bacterium]
MTIALLLLAVVLGVAGAFVFPAEGKGLKYFTAFSGGLLLSISFLELLPESFKELGSSVGFWILAGFFLQIILDFFSKGLEHGHVHLDDKEHGRVPYLLLVGLYLHALLEGMSLHEHASGDILSRDHNHGLLWGIVVHKIPVALILFQFLRVKQIKWPGLFVLMAIFALMSPLGRFMSEYVQALNSALPKVKALVVGIFLHIAATILYESTESHRFNALKLFAVGIGLAAGWATVAF